MSRAIEIPDHVVWAYGSKRKFKEAKRAQLRVLIKAYNELRVGSAFLPTYSDADDSGNTPLGKIEAGILELHDAMRVEKWGR